MLTDDTNLPAGSPTGDQPANDQNDQPTTEDLLAVIQEQNHKIDQLTETHSKELEELRKVLTPAEEPPADEEFKPSSWKELADREQKVAEETAMRVLKQAEEEKERIRKEEEDRRKKEGEILDGQISQLEKDGILAPETDDLGKRQRAQIYGMASNLQTADLIKVATNLKSAWDQGVEYDFQNNVWVNPTKNSFTPGPANLVASSASRTPAPRTVPVSELVRRAHGNLDNAQELWESGNR